ncbi:hypothetical protein D3C87_1570570 [compost metagenome]
MIMPRIKPTMVVASVCSMFGQSAGIWMMSVVKTALGRGSTIGLIWKTTQAISQATNRPTINEADFRFSLIWGDSIRPSPLPGVQQR